jgi:GMP synthase-like glutamine amidotransferase
MAKLRAHYFQHVPFEGLGSIQSWLDANGYDTSSTGFFAAGHQLPAVDAVDLLIIMGGPMSVNDEADLPWLAAEKQFVRDCIAAGKPVVGICLGAQLIANCLGGKVYPNGEKEIGWFPVLNRAAANLTLFQFPEEFTAFHWHGETFDLPEGASLLASSHACKNQAFQIGSKVIGLQFHLETTPASAQALVKHCGDELVAGDYIQSPGQILFAQGGEYEQINGIMRAVLDYVAK